MINNQLGDNTLSSFYKLKQSRKY